MSREIEIFSDVDGFSFQRSGIEDIYKFLDSTQYGINDGALSIAFLNESSMRDVHSRFLQDDTLTDVITFDGDSDMQFAGEICVSPDYALASYIEHGTTFSEEVTLYLVHGYLHLAGLNDILDRDIVAMRSAEKYCLDGMKKSGLIPEFLYNKQISCK